MTERRQDYARMILDIRDFGLSAGAIARHGKRLGHDFTADAVLKVVDRESRPKEGMAETIRDLWVAIPEVYKTQTKV